MITIKYLISVTPNLKKLLEDYQALFLVQNLCYTKLETSNDGQVAIFFLEADHAALTADDLLSLSNIATQHNDPNHLHNIRNDYNKYKKDGKSYHDLLHDNFVKDYRLVVLTLPDCFAIEAQIKEPLSNLRNGDWMSAQYQFDQVVPALPLTQQMYDDIKTYIDDYITNNYPA